MDRYECRACGASFGTPGEFERHVTTAHGESRLPLGDSSAPADANTDAAIGRAYTGGGGTEESSYLAGVIDAGPSGGEAGSVSGNVAGPGGDTFPSAGTAGAPGRTGQARTYICAECGSTFSTREEVERHLRSHKDSRAA